MTELDKWNILKQYKNGMPVVEICNLNNISQKKLNQFLKPYIADGTVQPRYAKAVYRKLTEDERKAIAEDYFGNGMKCFDLYEKWKINPVHLHQIREKYAMQYDTRVRHKIPTRAEYEKIAKDYYVVGLTREEIKKKWGVKSNTTFDTLGKMFGEKYCKKKVGRKNANRK